jgi:hypothetical protein
MEIRRHHPDHLHARRRRGVDIDRPYRAAHLWRLGRCMERRRLFRPTVNGSWELAAPR